MEEDKVERIRDLLWPETEDYSEASVYAIIDAGRSDDVFIRLMESGCQYINLFKGQKGRELATVAPYLLELEDDHPFTLQLLSDGWGDSWGIFCRCDLPPQKVRDHFRKFLMVADEEGAVSYFRYYDPRVLRVYLPTCNKEELATVFGPVEQFLVEGEEGKAVLEFSFEDGKLKEKAIKLC